MDKEEEIEVEVHEQIDKYSRDQKQALENVTNVVEEKELDTQKAQQVNMN